MAWITLFITVLCALATCPAFARQHLLAVDKPHETVPLPECFFLPPKGWEIADPKMLSPRVKIAFVKNTGKGFRPSINLAVEQTQASTGEYLKAVRAIHEQDRTNQWRALGKVRTAAGLAQLTEIDSQTEYGPVRLLQLILVKEGYAWILTAVALKEEFPDFYREFHAAFRSLTLTSDLAGNIPQFERRENLKTRQQQLLAAAQAVLETTTSTRNLLEDPLFHENHWAPFQQTILNDFTDMGAHWQVLLLRETREKLLAFQIPKSIDAPVKEAPYAASLDAIPAEGMGIVKNGASDTDPATLLELPAELNDASAKNDVAEKQRLRILQLLTQSWPMAPGFKQRDGDFFRLSP